MKAVTDAQVSGMWTRDDQDPQTIDVASAFEAPHVGNGMYQHRFSVAPGTLTQDKIASFCKVADDLLGTTCDAMELTAWAVTTTVGCAQLTHPAAMAICMAAAGLRTGTCALQTVCSLINTAYDHFDLPFGTSLKVDIRAEHSSVAPFLPAAPEPANQSKVFYHPFDSGPLAFEIPIPLTLSGTWQGYWEHLPSMNSGPITLKLNHFPGNSLVDAAMDLGYVAPNFKASVFNNTFNSEPFRGNGGVTSWMTLTWAGDDRLEGTGWNKYDGGGTDEFRITISRSSGSTMSAPSQPAAGVRFGAPAP